jgi:thioredoxin-dependent peroxiredoxin
MSASAASLEIGQRAPDWSGEAYGDGEEKSLRTSSLKGQPYILYFYPKDNTPGCTTQACDFRDRLERLSVLGYKVIGCSPDSLKSHQNFQKKQGFNFDLLSDPEHLVAEAFGVWREKKNYGRTYMGIVRSTFIINAEGEITHLFDNIRAKGHVKRLIDLLS